MLTNELPNTAISQPYAPVNMSNPDVVDHRAYGLASEALQATRSLETITALQFRNVDNRLVEQDKKHEEIKKMISEIDKRMEEGFKGYDNKFWSLSITLILLLLGIIGFLLVQIFFKGHA